MVDGPSGCGCLDISDVVDMVGVLPDDIPKFASHKWLSIWRVPNHPPKRIVHQTVSIYLLFVQTNFFECARFLSSAPFEFNLAS